MNLLKSDFGPRPKPEKMLRSIEHNDPSLKLKVTTTTPQGDYVTNLQYSTDGKEVINKTRLGEAKTVAKWERDTLVIESRTEVQGNQLVQSDRWTLADEGKTLRVQSIITTPTGDLSLAIVFEKQ